MLLNFNALCQNFAQQHTIKDSIHVLHQQYIIEDLPDDVEKVATDRSSPEFVCIAPKLNSANIDTCPMKTTNSTSHVSDNK